jgi:molybdopterin-guanine dinucleotide biosynthesis protein A
MDLSSIEGLILCGGQAQRMGGQDKGLIELQKKPLFQHGIARLAPQVGSLMINANRNLAIYEESGHRVYADSYLNFSGPLAGFHAGLKNCTAPFLAIIPCDSPLFPNDLVSRLYEALIKENADVSYVVTRNASGEKYSHPVFCLLRKTVLNKLCEFLDKGDRKIDRWFHQLPYVEVMFENDEAFSNINSPEDLAHIEGLLK